MKVIFMGTPEFAVPSLQALLQNGYEVCMVVTQPDRPKGRGHQLAISPVKEVALQYGIPVYQPEKVKNQEFTDKLRDCQADLMVTAAYGKILTEEALQSAPLGCINVHASLLPKYRGAAPLWWVLIHGETKTGITTMLTDPGMDTGDILEAAEYEIHPDLTLGELSSAMAELGAKTLLSTLEKLQKGTMTRRKQDHRQATYAPMIEKSTGCISWDSLAREIHNLVRGTNPWPVAYTYYNGQRMRIYKTQVVSESETAESPCGTILNISDAGILVSVRQGTILLTEIQFDSSKRMAVKDYLRGHEMQAGIVLGG